MSKRRVPPPIADFGNETGAAPSNGEVNLIEAGGWIGIQVEHV